MTAQLSMHCLVGLFDDVRQPRSNSKKGSLDHTAQRRTMEQDSLMLCYARSMVWNQAR